MNALGLDLIEFVFLNGHRLQAERDYPGIMDHIETYLLDTLHCTQTDFINSTVYSFGYYRPHEPRKVHRIINVLIAYGRYFILENPDRSSRCLKLANINEFVAYALTEPEALYAYELEVMMRQIRGTE